MELIKKNIHMNKIKCKTTMQMTLDDDVNVPDIKPDIEKIVKEQAIVKITDYKILNERLMIEGVLEFGILYISSEDGRLVHCINGKIPFEDVVNMDNAHSEDMIKIRYYLDDLTATMVNSRKISVRAIVSFECIAENIYDEETVVDIICDEKEGVESVHKNILVTQIAVNKKDTYRVKEEIILPSSKQNVMEILYSDVALQAFDTRVMEGNISIKGELLMFVMYTSENGDTEYLEKEIPFSGNIDVEGCQSDMIDDISTIMTARDICVKADTDGEERVLELEVVLAMDIKLYCEDELQIVKDFYAIGRNVRPVVSQGFYDNVLMKNNSKLRLVDRVRIEDNEPAVLQLCNSMSVARIDDCRMADNALMVEGILEISLMYITNDDSLPVNSVSSIIPFNQAIEVKGINQDCIYSVRPAVENCSVIMTDSRELEVKASLAMDSIVFERRMEDIIKDYEEVIEEEENKSGNNMAMVGYVVKRNECLWDLAKRYHTTRECIKVTNFLEGEEIKEGDRLLIIRQG